MIENISKEKAKELINNGRGKLARHDVFWLKIRPWRKQGQIKIFSWDSGLKMFSRPVVSKATKREWEN